MKALVILFAICLVAIQCFAQDKFLAATKVDEYEGTKSVSPTIETKIRAFLDRLSKLPRTTNGVIIIYPEFISTCSLSHPWKSDEETVQLVAHTVAEYKDISKNRFKIIRADPYLRTTTEFWLVPKGAKQPEPEKKESIRTVAVQQSI